MNITLVAVSSLNGKITRGNEADVALWTSMEDKKLFASLIAKAHLIVMGRQTYEAGKSQIKLQKGKLRIILTRNPERFRSETVPGQLEFTNAQPVDLIKSLEKRGYRQMLLAGGGEINALFLKDHLVDEIRVTIEPQVFGQGKPLIKDGTFAIPLRLIAIQKLNKRGSLHLNYKVIKKT